MLLNVRKTPKSPKKTPHTLFTKLLQTTGEEKRVLYKVAFHLYK